MAFDIAIVLGTLGIAFLFAYIATIVMRDGLKIFFLMLSFGTVILLVQEMILVVTDLSAVTYPSRDKILELLTTSLTISIVIFWLMISIFLLLMLINLIMSIQQKKAYAKAQREIE